MGRFASQKRASVEQAAELWEHASDDLYAFNDLYEQAQRTSSLAALRKVAKQINNLMNVSVWAKKAAPEAYSKVYLPAFRALSAVVKRKDADVGEIRDAIESFRATTQWLLNDTAPEMFTHKGIKVYNPAHLSDTLAYRALNGIDFVQAIFKKRGVSPALLKGIARITLVPERNALGAMAHFNSGTRELVLAADALGEKGRFAPSAAGETIIHELGHYVHRNFISGDAAAAWDAPWEELVRKGIVPSLAQNRYMTQKEREDRSRRLDPLEIVTDYGKVDKYEDFAETFLVYFVAPSKLTPTAKFRMQRALSLAGLHGSEVMRVASAARLASRWLRVNADK